MSKHLTGYTVRIAVRPVVFDTVPPGTFTSEDAYHMEEHIDGMLIDASQDPERVIEQIARRVHWRLNDVLQKHRAGHAKI